MYTSNVTNDYDNILGYDNITFTNCTSTENEDFNIIINCLFLSKPSGILLFSLKNLMVHALIKLLFNNK